MKCYLGIENTDNADDQYGNGSNFKSKEPKGILKLENG